MMLSRSSPKPGDKPEPKRYVAMGVHQTLFIQKGNVVYLHHETILRAGIGSVIIIMVIMVIQVIIFILLLCRSPIIIMT